MKLITDEKIIKLYKKAERDHGMCDGWEIAAYIIDELIPEKERYDHPSFYFHVHAIWETVQEYINSTYRGTKYEYLISGQKKEKKNVHQSKGSN